MTYRLPSVVAVVAFLALAAPSVRAEGKKSGSTPYVHTVIFYLKADAPAGTADEILADCHEMLSKIPTVRLLKAGRTAEDVSPPTKKDFAVGLLVLFDDVEGFKAYAKHPQHLKFVSKHGKNLDVSKLAIYDFVDAKK
jgi:stress responsive alpha/beta barrel protein